MFFGILPNLPWIAKHAEKRCGKGRGYHSVNRQLTDGIRSCRKNASSICFYVRIMKTYHIFTGSSTGYNPAHTIQAASFAIVDGVYVFYDEAMNILHAIAVAWF